MNIALNNWRRKRVHSWNKPYNRICLIKNCKTEVYWDGEIYYSLCLGCLETLQLGPFRPKDTERDDEYY